MTDSSLQSLYNHLDQTYTDCLSIVDHLEGRQTAPDFSMGDTINSTISHMREINDMKRERIEYIPLSVIEHLDQDQSNPMFHTLDTLLKVKAQATTFQAIEQKMSKIELLQNVDIDELISKYFPEPQNDPP
ncbi:hypothetical protein BLNAU_78 [Blattamonas nauphoetae]|uniref:Mediator of RNA polymerase II transcription subunit 10 n=1 Tax=Blattamonas nauphoetae TaxID=2049346 RepID=A0ABQ9YM03_9EUKA|nr:hypothetical protein BLNAU_78 [Blattamonas nauphoetae]